MENIKPGKFPSAKKCYLILSVSTDTPYEEISEYYPNLYFGKPECLDKKLPAGIEEILPRF